MTEQEIGRIRQASHERMQEGLAMLATGNHAAALPEFEAAAGLRETLPWREDPELAWMLAVAWINRADAVAGSAADGWQTEARKSLNRAIAALRSAPLDAHPAMVDRLVLALLKRAEIATEPTKDQTDAEELLLKWGGDTSPERLRLSAMLAVNRSRRRLDRNEVAAGLADARRALGCCRTLEKFGQAGVEGIAARAVLCRALAMRLDVPEELEGDWIGEATDAAEEALALAGSSGLSDPCLADLLRYGAKIYRVCQPHFLGEFLTEWLTGHGPLAGDAGLKKEMTGELLLARVDLERRVLRAPHLDEVVERQMRILKSLQTAEARLGGM